MDLCPDGRVVKNEQAGGGWKYKRGKNKKTYDAAIKEKSVRGIARMTRPRTLRMGKSMRTLG